MCFKATHLYLLSKVLNWWFFSPLPPFSFLMIHICKSTESPVNGKVGCGQRFSLLRRDEHGVEWKVHCMMDEPGSMKVTLSTAHKRGLWVTTALQSWQLNCLQNAIIESCKKLPQLCYCKRITRINKWKGFLDILGNISKVERYCHFES